MRVPFEGPGVSGYDAKNVNLYIYIYVCIYFFDLIHISILAGRILQNGLRLGGLQLQVDFGDSGLAGEWVRRLV